MTKKHIGRYIHTSDTYTTTHGCGAQGTNDGVVLEIQGGRLRAYFPGLPGRANGGGLRGRVTEMSNASRRRLMEKFASLDYAELARRGVPLYFVTLTTPPEFWDDVQGVYMALRRFRDRFEYHQAAGDGYLGAFVRRELGAKRGMLHYHLVVVGGASVSASWLSRVWSQCLGTSKRVRVDIDEVQSPERIARYLGKYCAKVGYQGKVESPPQGPTEERERPSVAPGGAVALSKPHNVGNVSEGEYTGGRWWYIWGESRLPWAAVLQVLDDDGAALAKRVRRIFRRWRTSKVRETFKRKCTTGKFTAMSERAFAEMENREIPLKRYAREDPFIERLRRYGGGFSVFVTPELLERMVEAAILGEVHNRGLTCAAI